MKLMYLPGGICANGVIVSLATSSEKVSASQREPLHTVHPLLGFDEAPNQQEVFDRVPDRDLVGYENQARATAFLEALVEPARHCRHIVRDEDTAGQMCKVQDIRAFILSGIIACGNAKSNEGLAAANPSRSSD